MYITCPAVWAKAINISTRKTQSDIQGCDVTLWMTTIEIVDEKGNVSNVFISGKTLEGVTPSFNPYVGTERGSDEHPF
jgi:hypothetical protein